MFKAKYIDFRTCHPDDYTNPVDKLRCVFQFKSDYELSEYLGITRQAVRLWRRDAKVPRKWAYAFSRESRGVLSVADLMGFDPEPTLTKRAFDYDLD